MPSVRFWMSQCAGNSNCRQSVRGSLVTLQSRCGKDACRCARSDHRHRRYYLSWSEAGRTQMMYIPKTRLEEFRHGIEAWKQFKQLSQQLARHNAQTLKQKGVLGP